MTCDDNYDFSGSMRTAAVDHDAEWQRVNSYVADVVKDCYVLFAKLARLRGDFAGPELDKIDDISSKVRDLGQELAGFSKAFTEGGYSMNKKEQYGGGQGDVELPPGFEPQAEDFDFSTEKPTEETGEERTEDFDFGEEEPKEKPEEPKEKPEEPKGKTDKKD